MREIALLDQFFDVVGNVGAEITAAECQFAYRHLRIADIEQHHSLDIVDIVDAKPFELELDDLEKMAMQTFDERNYVKIGAIHQDLDW